VIPGGLDHDVRTPDSSVHLVFAFRTDRPIQRQPSNQQLTAHHPRHDAHHAAGARTIRRGLGADSPDLAPWIGR
jgi:hypothetical protein